MKSENKSLSAQMDSTNIDAPEETIVSIYKETEKPSLWTRFTKTNKGYLQYKEKITLFPLPAPVNPVLFFCPYYRFG